MKRSRPRRQRKSASAAQGRKADALWSSIVRRPGRCEICGSTERIQAAHGFSRRYRGTRWLLINGFCLCSGCHVSFTHNPIGWDDHLRKAWGQPVYDELRALAQAVCKPDFGKILSDLESA